MKVALLLVALLLAACTDEDRARTVLSNQGYTQIHFTGYKMFSCSEDDTVKTGFIAHSPAKIRVEGVVCCGLLTKSCTIRFE